MFPDCCSLIISKFVEVHHSLALTDTRRDLWKAVANDDDDDDDNSLEGMLYFSSQSNIDIQINSDLNIFFSLKGGSILAALL